MAEFNSTQGGSSLGDSDYFAHQTFDEGVENQLSGEIYDGRTYEDGNDIEFKRPDRIEEYGLPVGSDYNNYPNDRVDKLRKYIDWSF